MQYFGWLSHGENLRHFFHHYQSSDFMIHEIKEGNIIPKEELMFTGITMEKQLEKGWFSIMVGDLSYRVYVE